MIIKIVNRSNIALWSMAALAAALFGVQAALAESDTITLRFGLNVVLSAGVALAVMGLKRQGWRAVNGPPPEAVGLALAGLAALSVWAAAWWLMDLTNSGLERAAGPLPRPASILDFSDALFGQDIQAATYELEILGAVVLVPLAQAWLAWGLAWPEAAALIGPGRAAWVVGGLAGALGALGAVQNLAPALPWGLAALGGYVLIGCVAGLAVWLTGSPWAGFSAQATFAYACFAWRDDLLRQMRGKAYLDPAWLTVIVLGIFGAAVLLQAVRYRSARPPAPPRNPRRAALRLGLPLALMLAAVIVMATVEIDARRVEQRARDAAQSSQSSSVAPLQPPE